MAIGTTSAWASLVTWAILSTSAGPASAAPASSPVEASLEWTLAEPGAGCMTDREIQTAVEGRLRRRVFVPPAEADVVLAAELTPDASGGWKAVLELATRDGRRFGRRTLHTDETDCSELDDSLALVVALLLDAPREQLEREAGGPLEQPKAAPEPKPESEPPPPAPHEPIVEQWRFSASALGVGALALLPPAGVGLRLRVGVKPPGLPALDLDATGWADARAAEGPRGVMLSLVTLGLHVCPLLAQGKRIRLELCLGQYVGRMRASGFGLLRTTDQSRLVYNLSGRLSASVAVLGPLNLRVGVGAEAPLLRDDFFFTAAGGEKHALFRMSPVVGAAEAGLGVDW